MSSPPRLPSRRAHPIPRDPFVSAILLGPRGRLAVGELAPFWRVVAALGPTVARVVVLDRGDRSSAGILLPGIERRNCDPSRPELELMLEEVSRIPCSDRAVVALGTASLASWPDEALGLVDDYAAKVVAAFGAVATLETEGASDGAIAGAALVAGDRLADLPRLGLCDGGRAAPSVTPFALQALRRLRDLDVPPREVTGELAAGLSGVRRIVTRIVGGRRHRLAIDGLSLPTTTAEGSAVRVHVEGWIVDSPPVRRLALVIGERRYPFDVDVERADVAARSPFLPDTRCGFRFAGRFGPLPRGSHLVSLERLDGRRLRRLGRIEVLTATSASQDGHEGLLHVRLCETLVANDGLRLVIEGELDGGEPVDSLRIELDGRHVFDVDRRHFVARLDSDAAFRTFRFEEFVTLAEGAHAIAVTAVRGTRTIGSWRGRLAAHEPSRERVELRCPTLETLLRDAPAPVWGALGLEGEILGAETGDRVEAWIDAARASATRVREDGRFAMQVEAASSGEHEVELRLVRSERIVTRRGPAIFRSRSVAAPARWPAAIDRLLASIGKRAERLAGIPTARLARDLAECAGEALGEVDVALAELARRAALAERTPGRIAAEVLRPVARPLRVLFASWEIPWSGHGGGTCMVNLLRHLGARHEVTVLHPVAPGEDGLSEEVRPFVREILTVPRGWQQPTALAPFGTPTRYLWTFSRDLRRALAAELASQRFELANLEYEGLCLHSAHLAPVPRLFVLHDLVSFGVLTEASADPDPERTAGAALAALVGALHFDAVEVADRFDRLATLTEPEALHLLPFLPGRELQVLPIPVDLERYRPAGGVRESAAFAFVGTYRHPPNLAAAEELITEVAPRLRARVPGATLRLVGADPPPRLVDRAAAAGVEMLGWVDDLPAELGRCTAFLAPLRQGAGMRVKLLEAMGAGCPVVSTELGMSGIAAPPGEAYLRAESVDEFVDAAVALTTAPERGAALARAARAVVERDHGIAAQAERRERIWGAMLEEDPGG